MKTTKDLAADGTITLTMTIPWNDIQGMYEEVVKETVANAELSGFRKGKAPRDMVEKTLDKTKTYEETIKRLVPKVYSEAVQEHEIKPIMMPQVELKEAQEEKDWVVLAKTCERPTVKLKDYKAAVAKVKADSAPKIVVPGKEQKDEKKGPTVDDILTALLTAIDATIPEILLDHEVTHQLSQLVDQTKKLGLTVEQYFSSTGKTAEGVREEYKSQAKNNLTLEFGLEAVADAEQVSVSDEEVARVIAGAKTPEEKASMESQKYYIATILRRQKTIDKLMA